MIRSLFGIQKIISFANKVDTYFHEEKYQNYYTRRTMETYIPGRASFKSTSTTRTATITPEFVPHTEHGIYINLLKPHSNIPHIKLEMFNVRVELFSTCVLFLLHPCTLDRKTFHESK